VLISTMSSYAITIGARVGKSQNKLANWVYERILRGTE